MALVCCNKDLFTHGLLSLALSSKGGEGSQPERIIVKTLLLQPH
jgi:hypothetical protein